MMRFKVIDGNSKNDFAPDSDFDINTTKATAALATVGGDCS